MFLHMYQTIAVAVAQRFDKRQFRHALVDMYDYL